MVKFGSVFFACNTLETQCVFSARNTLPQRLDSSYHSTQFSANMSSKKTSKKASEKSYDDKLEEFVKTQLSCLKLEEVAETRKKCFRHVLTAEAIDSHVDEDVGPLVFFNILSSNAKVKKGESLAAMKGSKRLNRGIVYEMTQDNFTLSVKNTESFPVGHETDFCVLPCDNSEVQRAVSEILSSSVYKAGDPATRVRDVLMGLARARTSTLLKPVEFFNQRQESEGGCDLVHEAEGGGGDPRTSRHRQVHHPGRAGQAGHGEGREGVGLRRQQRRSGQPVGQGEQGWLQGSGQDWASCQCGEGACEDDTRITCECEEEEEEEEEKCSPN